MDVSVRNHPAGFPIFVVSAEGSEYELSAFGGQLLSWTKGGVPILFSNRERAILDGKAAYRGGGPICFPYFGKGNLLPSEVLLAPQHGRARASVWESEAREGESAIVLRTEQPAPEGFGPTTLACELTYVFGEGVRIEGRVTNTGEAESPFQLAVHTYWAASEPGAVTVRGLGERYLDNLAGLREERDPASSAAHSPVFDRVYPDSSAELEVRTEAYRLSITTQGCAGAVLWNPGVEHTLADLGAPDFVCVENGVIVPGRLLGAGEGFGFGISYEVGLLG